MGKNKIVIIASLVFLYLFSAGVSYAVFSKTTTQSSGITSPIAQSTPGAKNKFTIDTTLPKTEICPLNGEKYTKKEKEVWEKRRPLAVMIENHKEARPQSGLSRADVVYEAVAEGGITRFMPVFYCGAATGNIPFAPVRSARTYFLNWVLEYDALYNHVGGAGRCNDETVDDRAKALCQIGQFGIKDLDQFGIGFPNCYRNPDRLDHPVATEHQMVCFSDKLYEVAKERGWTNLDDKEVSWDKNFEQWKFKDDEKKENRGILSKIDFTFWKGYDDFAVTWEYDKENNLFKRLTAEQVHSDLETEEQLSAKNVVILFAEETGGVDEHAHLLYENWGSGKALIFQDGKATGGTWKKPKKTSRTKFYDPIGKEIQFVRGQIWIEMVPIGTEIKYN